MKVLVVQPPDERKNRIPDFSEPHLKDKVIRVSSVDEAISSIKKNSPGLVIVDVEIENGTGFKVFEATMDVTYDKIVLTETAAHVVKSIRFDVSQYLLKPLQADEIHDAVVSTLFKQKKHGIQKMFNTQFGHSGFARLTHLFVPLGDSSCLVEAKELIMVENLTDLRRLYFTDGKVLHSTASFARLGQLLKGHGFVRPSEDILINPRHVVAIQPGADNAWAVMFNDCRFQISYQMERRIRHRRIQDDIRPPLPE